MSGPRTAALAVAAGLGAALSLTAAPVVGQQPDELTGLLDSVAELWSDGNAVALAAQGAERGLDLEVNGQAMGLLERRRAAAALRHIFATLETVSVETAVAARVSGAEGRAFGEFIWVVRIPGVDATERHRIFIALVRQEQEWRISQIRILR